MNETNLVHNYSFDKDKVGGASLNWESMKELCVVIMYIIHRKELTHLSKRRVTDDVLTDKNKLL